MRIYGYAIVADYKGRKKDGASRAVVLNAIPGKKETVDIHRQSV
jgi:hypothetical protein